MERTLLVAHPPNDTQESPRSVPNLRPKHKIKNHKDKEETLLV